MHVQDVWQKQITGSLNFDIWRQSRKKKSKVLILTPKVVLKNVVSPLVTSYVVSFKYDLPQSFP